MYKIESGIMPNRNTRWSVLSGAMKAGDSVVVANSNEAIGLRWALKKRGKVSRQGVESAGKGGQVRVFCMGMMEKK